MSNTIDLMYGNSPTHEFEIKVRESREHLEGLGVDPKNSELLARTIMTLAETQPLHPTMNMKALLLTIVDVSKEYGSNPHVLTTLQDAWINGYQKP